MTTLTIERAPLENNERIRFIDALRGFALLGVLIMNIMAAAAPHAFYFDMNLHQPITGLNYYAWLTAMVGVQSVMRGLFSVLFGAGALLLLDRLEKSGNSTAAADIYYRRVIWLFVFGVVNAFLFLWWGDILYYYGLLGLFLFPFRKLSVRKLMIPVVLLLAFGVYRESGSLSDQKAIITKGREAALLKSKHIKLTETQQADLGKWEEYQQQNSPAGMMKEAEKEIAERRHMSFSNFITACHSRAVRMESSSIYNGWYDVAIFFFLGMALYRSGFITGLSRTRIYVLTAIICLPLSLYYNYRMARESYIAGFDGVRLTVEASVLKVNQLRRLLQVLGYISIIALLYRLTAFRRLFNLFAPAGQMAFTNYLVQSLFMLAAFFGFGLYGRLQRYEVFGLALGFYGLQMVFSHLWLRYFRFGPFEWLWRSLTYLQWQPITIAGSTAHNARLNAV